MKTLCLAVHHGESSLAAAWPPAGGGAGGDQPTGERVPTAPHVSTPVTTPSQASPRRPLTMLAGGARAGGLAVKSPERQVRLRPPGRLSPEQQDVHREAAVPSVAGGLV